MRLVAVLLVALVAPPVASAGDRLSEMSFTFDEVDARYMQMGVHQNVYADGPITPGTAARLQEFLELHHVIPSGVVVLNSHGGDLAEGILIGRLIRQHNLYTSIGVNTTGTASRDGVCYSACTIAFLGGERRFISEGSQFGVHRFFVPQNTMSGVEALDASQILSGAVVDYVGAMGVKHGFVLEMDRASSRQLNFLSQQQLSDLNVITKLYETTWEIKALDGDFYIVGATIDLRGTHKILFACPSRNKGIPIIMLMYNALTDGPIAAASVVSLAFRINGGDVAIPPSEILRMPSFANNYVQATTRLDKMTIGMLRIAQQLGFSMLRSGGDYMGFDGDFISGRNKVFDYTKSCR